MSSEGVLTQLRIGLWVEQLYGYCFGGYTEGVSNHHITTGFELSTHIWPTKEINFSVFLGD